MTAISIRETRHPFSEGASPVRYHHGKFPPVDLDWTRLIPLIGPARGAVAGYDALLPNPDVLLSPLTTQESVLSTRIEGTQTSLEEVYKFEASGAKNDNQETKEYQDIQEVLNYRQALRFASHRLNSLPMSQRLIRETHERMMQSVRGENKDPGSYRRIQNHIGAPGTPIEGARYVPPAPLRVPELMNQLELFIQSKYLDTIVHVEFEAIHPFLDGNGRLGRLLVPLFLKDKGILSNPNFYLSGYLEARRQEYYGRLLAVSRDDDWTGWCVFLLLAVTEQANTNRACAERILNLYEERKEWMTEVTRSQFAIRALDWFFNKPVFSSSQFIEESQIPKPTAQRILRLTEQGGLLQMIRPARGRAPRIFAYNELLRIADGGNGA